MAGRRPGVAVQQGVRAAARAGLRSDARVHARGVDADGLGLERRSRRLPDADARYPCRPLAAQALGGRYSSWSTSGGSAIAYSTGWRHDRGGGGQRLAAGPLRSLCRRIGRPRRARPASRARVTSSAARCSRFRSESSWRAEAACCLPTGFAGSNWSSAALGRRSMTSPGLAGFARGYIPTAVALTGSTWLAAARVRRGLGRWGARPGGASRAATRGGAARRRRATDALLKPSPT